MYLFLTFRPLTLRPCSQDPRCILWEPLSYESPTNSTKLDLNAVKSNYDRKYLIHFKHVISRVHCVKQIEGEEDVNLRVVPKIK
jgi:hypothetical protein